MKKQLSSAWFSRYFGINKPQYELPFVDFLLNTDVPLYIDSFAITKDRSELAIRCHDSIISYFQTLLDAVRVGDNKKIRYLIYDRLVEPREIHLGVAIKARTGVGLGRIQGGQIVEALANSQALKSGVIHDIQELELHIEGIGPDKISDLVANIIKGQLARYTQDVCQQYEVRTRHCAVNSYWNDDTLRWDADYYNLPIKGTDSYILVPKRFVRREKDMVNHHQFYDRYVLVMLQGEMLSANDSLVETLKNGKRRVTKKSLRENPRFAPTKAYISRFIQEHPDTIEQYRGDLNTKFVPLDPAALSGKATAQRAATGTGMKAQDQYLQFVRWSGEDKVYVGYCPDLFPAGGVCHGATPVETCVSPFASRRRSHRRLRLRLSRSSSRNDRLLRASA